MDPKSTLTLVGLSHRTAPVAVRERYSVSQADLPSCLTSILKIEGVSEAFVLSTCNRTEALIVAPRGVDVSAQVRAQLFRNLEDAQAYVYEDVQALIHVFRVASGLDSVVVGESEVLAQIKRGTEAAQAAQTLGPLLRPLLQQALSVGKRVRTETAVGQGTLSVARVGVDVASRVFGRFENQNALVIGAGETGVLVAKHLKELRIGALFFANRTIERAQAVAHEMGASGHGLDDLPALIAKSDIIVACVEGQTTTVDASAFDRRIIRRRDKPLLVIDLSMPRAVGADVAQVDRNVLVYDLEDLSRVVRENEKDRSAAVEGTHEILVTELHKFLSLRTYAAFTPAIAVLRERFERVREEALDAIAGARSDPKDLQLAHEITRKLLDVALDQMKESARHTQSAESLDREYQRFLEEL
jgi:glutamyl-tRNA reductase